MTNQAITPAGWYRDPDHRHQYRYWSGTEWTPMVSDNAVTATDPVQPPAQPASAPGTSTPSGQQRSWDGSRGLNAPAPAGTNGPTPSPPAQGNRGPEARLAVATPAPTSRAARRKQRAIERAQPLLPPGTEIRQIFGAQTGSPLLLIVLMLLLAILPGALLFSVISKNRWIVVAPDAIYVLDCGHFAMTPKRVLRVLPRATRLGPPGGVWTKIHAGPDTLWAGRDADIAAADAEAAGFGAPAVLPAGCAAPAVLPAASKNPGLHAIASFFIPGLGTLLCGKTTRGLLILGLSAVSLFGVNILADALIGGEPTGIGTFLAIPLWVWGMVDGYRSAQQWNLEHVGEAESSIDKAELATSLTQRPNRAPEFHGRDLPGGDDPTRAAASTDQFQCVTCSKVLKDWHYGFESIILSRGLGWQCSDCGRVFCWEHAPSTFQNIGDKCSCGGWVTTLDEGPALSSMVDAANREGKYGRQLHPPGTKRNVRQE